MEWMSILPTVMQLMNGQIVLQQVIWLQSLFLATTLDNCLQNQDDDGGSGASNTFFP